MPLPSFCPTCGTPVQSTGRSSGICSAGHAVYANSKPAAGVLLVRGEQVLLIRRGAEPRLGTWDIPGGFLEDAEPPREGAVRELQEELHLALDASDLTLVLTSINPWPTGATLDIVYEAPMPDQEPRAGSDCAGFAWFDIDDLPTDLPFESTGEVLRRWRAWRAER